MNVLRTRSRIPVTLAIAGVLLVGTPLITGCSLINNVVNSATGGNVPEGLGTGQSVPADFPSDVPLIDGDVVFGLSLPGDNGEKAWNVTINVSGADAFETIKTQLTDAGFDYKELSAGESGSTGAFTKETLSVLVVVAAGDGTQWTANYTVTNAETSP
jgi:hypothetical protein